ncbi:XRE family transcriptional regulator [Mesorhizobium sp. M4B.F.Ca.ET.215.01.1.1]|nr:MAG: XRE family transcriptional regulator [Mesorhizobium sp.]TGQ05276.1 XRE family transcriptional regulator [Mesorhizobium sp. M4B.F.Ca.ET.215.01.1.1]TGQ30581.1 XRE family transcriptional regulator [Mesorhizobium sp. M00.F.Ca.ET.220.01.1.1]TGQ97823.1 XRE family transcriptional regulator [Mesorhizobium sp. M4B.F.Ca.ET.203.01.1.1]TIV38427.1 MAG: helix-turn-helix transcriptional regulator [Mesorhizobium sp.]
MPKDMDAYKIKMELVETIDPEIDKPVFRRPGFEGIKTFGELDERIAAFIRKAREDKDLTRAELAPLLGLSMQVYGRYERAFSKMHVTRMIHLCEILGFMPMAMLFSAAPHLWGRTEEEAHDTMELAQQIVSLPHGTKRDLLALVKKMVALERAAEGAAAETQRGEEGRL